MYRYIVDLRASRLPADVGNKASRLHFLAQHGYRVPRTHVCTWQAYLKYGQNDHSLIPALNAELQQKIDLARAYAVRSSANIEDGLTYSFAGQFKSVLDVQGVDNILQALWSIWATTRAPGVEAYLLKNGVDPQQLRMAALIQEMVSPVVSGVAFSKNPLTGLNEVLVEAVQGSGELLVRKGLTPERWVFSRGQWLAQPEQPQIDRSIVEDVVAQTRAITKDYGRPIDLEWVYDGQAVHWVQLREITTLSNVNIYSNHIAREMLPGLVKPLIWSINIPIVVNTKQKVLKELIGPHEPDPTELVKAFYYRAYFNMTAIGNILEMLGLPREMFEMMMGLGVNSGEKMRMKVSARTLQHLPRMLIFAARQMRLGRHIERFLPRMQNTYRQFHCAELQQMSEAELLAEIDRLFEINGETTYYNFLGPMFMFMYNAMLRRSLAKAEVDFQQFDLTSGLVELRAYEPDTHLRELSRQFQALDPACQEQIRRSSYAEFQRLPGLGAFQQAVAQFLAQFGHLSDSGVDCSSVPWRENPDLILRMIANYQALDDRATHKVRYEDLPPTLRRRPMFNFAYHRARKFRYYREAVSSLYTYGYGLFRPYFLALGEKFAQRNVLPSPEDIFYLYQNEVRDIVTQRSTKIDYAALTVQRRQEMEACRDVVAPSIIVGDQPPPVTQQTSHVLHGTPTSRGRYTGPARVIRGIYEFGKMRAGDVLVIPYSDAGWTPLFSKAGAVIAESGGILSHSSIVAREYNIPAVVSVAGACNLTDDVSVTIDGYSGEIMIHEQGATQEPTEKSKEAMS
jgi:phosphohistidine swiveling domain-containing protein